MGKTNSNVKAGTYPKSIEGRNETMDAFDLLPPEIRKQLRHAIFSISALSVSERLSRGENVQYAITLSENRYIRAVAEQYRDETGQEYPHIAARATVMR